MALSKRRVNSDSTSESGSISSHRDPFLEFGDFILEHYNESVFLKYSNRVKAFGMKLKNLCQEKNEEPISPQAYFIKVRNLKNEFETELDNLNLFQIDEYTIIRNYFAKVKPDDFNIDPTTGVLFCWIYEDWRSRMKIWEPHHNRIKEKFFAKMEQEESGGVVGYITGIFKPAIEDGMTRKEENRPLLEDQKKNDLQGPPKIYRSGRTKMQVLVWLVQLLWRLLASILSFFPSLLLWIIFKLIGIIKYLYISLGCILSEM